MNIFRIKINKNRKKRYQDKLIYAEENLSRLEESKICSEANGLRNVVVHKYNHVDKPLFIENAETLFNGIEGIMKRIKQIIKDEPK